MTGIDKTNLRSMAADIAKQLDRKDTNGEDGKIEASIWNKFVADKGGRQIKSHISLENAIKSITTYIARNAAKTGEAFGDIADKWFNNAAPIERIVTPPVRQVPASELPPQQFKMPEHIPAVKPLPYTEEDLEKMFVEPGKDVLEQRSRGKIVGETIADVIDSGGTFEEPINPKQAAYAFAALMNRIPNLSEKLDNNASDVVKNIYNGLIARAEELEIDLLEETELQSIDIENATSEEQIKICKAISDIISAHDESAINEMNWYQSIRTSKPELAGKTIEDKANGKTYIYDTNGKIETIREGNGEEILRTYDAGYAQSIELKMDDKCQTTIRDLNFDHYTNRIRFNGAYTEKYEQDGFIWEISRIYGGKLDSVYKRGIDSTYVEESWYTGRDHYKDLDAYTVQHEIYDKNGNLEYYVDNYCPNNGDYCLRSYRDKDGILIGTTELIGEVGYGSHPTYIYRNTEGKLIAIQEYSTGKEGGKYICKDADGNEINEEQFNELVDERLRG